MPPTKPQSFNDVSLTIDLTRGIEHHVTRNAILLHKASLVPILSIVAHKRLPATFELDYEKMPGGICSRSCFYTNTMPINLLLLVRLVSLVLVYTAPLYRLMPGKDA